MHNYISGNKMHTSTVHVPYGEKKGNYCPDLFLNVLNTVKLRYLELNGTV